MSGYAGHVEIARSLELGRDFLFTPSAVNARKRLAA
jgi:hypothetical protein